MSETKTADLVVIGAGPGGYVAAIRAAQSGLKVICIDAEFLGGVCLNWGCIPSKAMIHASSTVENLKSAAIMGIQVEGVTVDMAKMKAWKDTVVKRLTGGIGELFKLNGVEAVYGYASFVDGNTLKVEGSVHPDSPKQGAITIRTTQTIIATGARVVQLPGMEIDGERFLSAREALDLTETPKRLLVIGGGIVGAEIGTYMAKLGSKVTLVELAGQLLSGTDPELVKVVARGMKKRKIAVHLNSKVSGIEHKGDGMEAVVATPKGDVTVACDKVLVAVGFRPNTEKLNLAAAGVETDKRGHVVVDRQLRSSNPAVLAIGDVIGPPYLAHKASKEGLIAAEVVSGIDSVLDVKAMPAAIFTDPEVATVGLDEEAAKAAGYTVKTGQFPFAANGKSLASNHSEGFVKFVADAKDDTLLGVHIVGHEASNIITEAALAIEMGATVADIGLTVHPHPTLSETLMEAAHVVEGHAIHIFVPKG